ncbi:non-heme iron oxygenase ferredoxin subunit [Nonomuraea bangladeshensis]|uniref:Rieske (2Fe-2S) protein n=1 Tax=Nonomuraea bangladeshensis TaxID=404385 RepID=UPI0031E024B4
MTYRLVCHLSDIPEGGLLGVETSGTPLALVRDGGEVFALHDVCPHAGATLSEGEVDGGTLECWLHGSCFDIRTGKPVAPNTLPVTTYPVKVEDGGVFVAVPPPPD